SKIQATVEVPDDLDRLPPDTEIAVFRAVQECLANVHRHSGSTACSVKLVHDDHELRLQVSDGGCGIPREKLPSVMTSGGVGLRGMWERIRRLGGTVEIDSSDGGTTVTVKVPIVRPDDSRQKQRVA